MLVLFSLYLSYSTLLMPVFLIFSFSFPILFPDSILAIFMHLLSFKWLVVLWEQEKRVIGAKLLSVEGFQKAVQFPLNQEDFCVTLSAASFPSLQRGDKLTRPARGGEAMHNVIESTIPKGSLVVCICYPVWPLLHLGLLFTTGIANQLGLCSFSQTWLDLLCAAHTPWTAAAEHVCECHMDVGLFWCRQETEMG